MVSKQLIKTLKKSLKWGALLLIISPSFAQNPLIIPPALTGLNFNLTVQSGTTQFYPGISTPTYGINGAFLSPTIIVNKGDVVTLNVINNLTVGTTMHWHGLHVAAENDGGPHQLISAGTTWSPSFEILNNAATFWYHPHGEGKTELHVGKGLSGLFIVHDPAELALGLPQTYGVDDIPLILQTKAFDVLHQIAIADHMDTAVFTNGVIDAVTDFPAQVIRLRVLNGSSMRTFNVGFANDMPFYQIATDGGLVAAPNTITRMMLAPGERSELLVDLTGMNGQQLQLMSYGSEMPAGIYGSPSVGVFPDTMADYDMNMLNGADFQVLDVNVVAPTANPVTVIPTSLVPYTPIPTANADINRILVLDTIRLLPGDVPSLAEGPFGINDKTFDMDSINISIPLNSTEIWTLVNKTHIAHPFHIHDVQFNVIEKSGVTPPLTEQGWKDVVLVLPHDSVKFITQFTTFSDTMVPYMYHCHLLHHEDDGMMGSFLVVDPFAAVDEQAVASSNLTVFPNPTVNNWSISGNWKGADLVVEIVNTLGQLLYTQEIKNVDLDTITIPTTSLENGSYVLTVTYNDSVQFARVQKVD